MKVWLSLFVMVNVMVISVPGSISAGVMLRSVNLGSVCGVVGCALALAMRVSVKAVKRMMARVLAVIFLVFCSVSPLVTCIII